MEELKLNNPFGAPIFYKEIVGSTMEEARKLSVSAKTGTVIVAGVQEAGRGRGGRPWQSGGGNLFFTVLFHFPDYGAVPPALTLRTGLGVSQAIEDFAPSLAGLVKIKWPNDIIICGTSSRFGKKAAGILSEAVSGPQLTVYIGIGINVAERDFPPELRHRATSIALETGAEAGSLIPEKLLEKILFYLHEEFREPDWRERLDARLYLKGQRVRFIPGAAPADPDLPGAGSPDAVEGILAGIGPAGELLLRLNEGIRSYITGELDVYGQPQAK
jgi:BirA family biotin operon repressor/biotin-[acetyl-CoA-carboxylase] ligase